MPNEPTRYVWSNQHELWYSEVYVVSYGSGQWNFGQWMPLGWQPPSQQAFPETPESARDSRFGTSPFTGIEQSTYAGRASAGGQAQHSTQGRQHQYRPLAQPVFHSNSSAYAGPSYSKRPSTATASNVPNYAVHPSTSVQGGAVHSLDPRNSSIPRNKLDPAYKQKHKDFFTEGKIFSVVLNETAGSNAVAANATNDYNSTNSLKSVRWDGNVVWTNIRRFVVVRQRREFCFACPIFTYGGRATTKQGVQPAEHSIAYSWGQQPQHLSGEAIMKKAAIPVVMMPGEKPLHVASRINFGVHHPIHYDIQVKEIGYVPADSITNLIGNWKEEDIPDVLNKQSTAITELAEAGEEIYDPYAYHSEDNPEGYDADISPHSYHPDYNPYGYHAKINRYAFHPAFNTFGFHHLHAPDCYHPTQNPQGYHAKANIHGYHPVSNAYGFHDSKSPDCYHPTLNPDGYNVNINPHGFHPAWNPYGYHKDKSPETYHPKRNPQGYHHEHNPRGYHPTSSPYAYSKARNPHAFHKRDNPRGYHPSTNPHTYHPVHNQHLYHSKADPDEYDQKYNENMVHPEITAQGSDDGSEYWYGSRLGDVQSSPSGGLYMPTQPDLNPPSLVPRSGEGFRQLGGEVTRLPGTLPPVVPPPASIYRLPQGDQMQAESVVSSSFEDLPNQDPAEVTRLKVRPLVHPPPPPPSSVNLAAPMTPWGDPGSATGGSLGNNPNVSFEWDPTHERYFRKRHNDANGQWEVDWMPYEFAPQESGGSGSRT
ncbi:hypothetical protein T440DRAFT_558455 [Plenodomus tracheiphilus IPT5]|uniref:DUF6590 domain-containing protein n=1 Tax=Plenodomus tracheiphilus IPT5 TaxID=1408161 RepID=A0A6A7ASE0_9PLEO|nr:hypothetical protein T440DRAFT_558455 [Plenodomus tracheiphilus IPT5]